MSLQSKIDQIFKRWDKDDSPGMAIAVTKNGQTIHEKAYGMADLDHGLPNKPDTVFHCASLAKQFTAMSILLLSDETPQGLGMIELDQDVRDLIPQLKNVSQKITICQLLHHTSGIRDMLIQLTLAGWRWGDDAMTRDDVLGLVSRMKTLNFVPGSKFAYSNTNYFLAGEIVKIVSGQSLAEFAQKNIFSPLGMTSSTRFVETYCETVEGRAYGYRSSDRGSGTRFEKRMPNYDLTGPTNLLTTVGDLVKWDSNFTTPRVGGEEAVEALQRPAGNSNAYGLGLMVLRDGSGAPRKIYHNGRTIGHRAHLLHDYEQQISIALLCNVEFDNVEATDDLVFAVSLVVQGREPIKPMIDRFEVPDRSRSGPAEALRKYCGSYYSSEIDTEYEIEDQGSSLVIKRPRYSDHVLLDSPGLPDDTFVAKGLTDVLRYVEFTFVKEEASGDITHLQIDWPERIGGSRLTNFRFVKQ